jgi:hypothetical protein
VRTQLNLPTPTTTRSSTSTLSPPYSPKATTPLTSSSIVSLAFKYAYPSVTHFTPFPESRSGQIDLRTAEGDWCNVLNAGLGIRPTTSTGNTLIDAIVWVKPPGECDGTSNTSSPRFDPHCGQSDAAQPAPEAGTWCKSSFLYKFLHAIVSRDYYHLQSNHISLHSFNELTQLCKRVTLPLLAFIRLFFP